MCTKISMKSVPCGDYNEYTNMPQNKNRDVEVDSSEWSSVHTSESLTNFKVMFACVHCPMCKTQPKKTVNHQAMTKSIEKSTRNLTGTFEIFSMKNKPVAKWTKSTYVQTDIESATEAEDDANDTETEPNDEHAGKTDDTRVDSPVPA